MPHAELRESERVQRSFCGLHLRERLCGDRPPILDARAETGRGWFVCEREPGSASKRAYFSLVQARFGEWGDRMVHRGRTLPWPEVSVVVEVSAVGYVREVESGAGLFHLGEEFVFAVEAAVRVVALVVGALEFVGLEDLRGDVVFGGEGKGGGGNLGVAGREGTNRAGRTSPAGGRSGE